MARRARSIASILAVMAVAIGAACGGAPSARDAQGHLVVATAFYPLEWLSRRIGGEHVAVFSLTPSGAEPHDLELAPSDVAAVADAGLVVYLRGFQPAVDSAVTNASAARVLDVGPPAALAPRVAGSGSAAADPHFWLDPGRMSAVATAIAGALARTDAANASAYQANARIVADDLQALDRDLSAGLAHCEVTDLVTSHEAFGYFATRYGLHQVAIAGLSTDTEPSASALATVADLVRRRHVRTVYFETLTSPALARTIGDETGATTDQLDPVEGITRESRGRDYLEIMRANLATLRRGQGCA
jgi:zinc transport system substrate-binding protein